MTVLTNDFFKLVLQRDRRQQPDRRIVWRGGRREADAVPFSVPDSCGDALGDWTAAVYQGHTATEKTCDE